MRLDTLAFAARLVLVGFAIGGFATSVQTGCTFSEPPPARRPPPTTTPTEEPTTPAPSTSVPVTMGTAKPLPVYGYDGYGHYEPYGYGYCDYAGRYGYGYGCD